MLTCIDVKDEVWMMTYDELPKDKQDIYFTQQYYALHEANGDGEGKCLIYRESEHIAMYPFLMNKVSDQYDLGESYYDIETPNGYGGPISNCNEITFLKRFEKAVIEWMKANNIIAEFIRFHPFMDNENLFTQEIDVIKDRMTVYSDIEVGCEAIWAHQLSKGCKAATKQAAHFGITCNINRDYTTFIEIYEQTMSRLGANTAYYFSKDYFEQMKKYEQFMVLNALKDQQVVASCILMESEEYVHYHLSGSLEEYLSIRPNNFMIWKAIEYCEQKGKKKLHLGGGKTNQLDDSLYRFKKSFSSDKKSFYIGKRVHNRLIYGQVMNLWEQRNPGKKRSILLQYK